MNLKTELARLEEYYFSPEQEKFEQQYNLIIKSFSAEQEQIDQHINGFVQKSIQNADAFIEEAKIKVQLAEVSEIVSLSYIAKQYFNKTRTWLYQKINGNVVNGKEARFTDAEIQTFNFAIQDISRKLGSTVISV